MHKTVRLCPGIAGITSGSFSDPPNRPSILSSDTYTLLKHRTVRVSVLGHIGQDITKMTISPDTLGCSCSPMSVLARAPWRFGALRFDVRRIHAFCNRERPPSDSNGELMCLHLDVGPACPCCFSSGSLYMVNCRLCGQRCTPIQIPYQQMCGVISFGYDALPR